MLSENEGGKPSFSCAVGRYETGDRETCIACLALLPRLLPAKTMAGAVARLRVVGAAGLGRCPRAPQYAIRTLDDGALAGYCHRAIRGQPQTQHHGTAGAGGRADSRH